MQIIELTDPRKPSATAAVADSGTTILASPRGIDTHSITTGDTTKTYALVASFGEGGMQIIEITDPTSPAARGSLTDNASRSLLNASAVAGHKIGNKHYALVASSSEGVQIIEITDPASPSAVGRIQDSGTTLLNGAVDITTLEVTSGGSTKHYALVASFSEDGVQVIDFSDPTAPTAVASMKDEEGGYTELNGAYDITVRSISGGTYALVASGLDSGVQVIDITDPTMPAPADAVTDGEGGYTRLAGARGVDTTAIGRKLYAVVGALNENGAQIMEMKLVSDVTPPELSATDRPVLAADGKTLTITYNEPMKTTSLPGNSAFEVRATPAGGSEAELDLASSGGVSVSGSTVVLTMDKPIAHNDGR